MVASLDGFIAKEDGDISWMHTNDSYENGKTLTEDDITKFLEGIDCYLMGSKTYEHAVQLGWVYGDTPVVVLTNRALESYRASVSFRAGGLEKLVNEELKPKYDSIWAVGGASLTRDLLQLKLVDEIVLTLTPVLLGDGTLFFNHVGVEQPLHLKDVTAFDDGMVELTYEVNKDQ